MDRISAIGYTPQPGFLAAQQLGFFADENLAVELEPAVHAPTHNRGMAEGRWDLTLSSADTMIDGRTERRNLSMGESTA